MNKLILFSTAALIFLVGCGQVGVEMGPSENELTYLALGDSYTIGESVDEAERWPVQLVAGLREAGIAISDPVIVARTGWTTTNLLAAIERQDSDSHYDLVSLLIGVNNQYQSLSIETYRQEFKDLLAFAIEASGGHSDHIIVLSIPDWSFTPYAETIERYDISEEIDSFNKVALEESEAAGVPFFNITQLTRPVIFDPELFARDGLHPSGKMYTAWVEVVFPYVLDLLAADE